MRRNLLLLLVVLIIILLVVNSAKRLLVFRTTSQKVSETELRLSKLREENEALKKELEYKKGDEFAEEEIRNKLGLVREGEAVVIVSQDEKVGESSNVFASEDKPNWQKWWELFFGVDS